MPRAFDIADILAAGPSASRMMMHAVSGAALMSIIMTTMRPRGPGKTRAS
jgi:hypothetical protein